MSYWQHVMWTDGANQRGFWEDLGEYDSRAAAGLWASVHRLSYHGRWCQSVGQLSQRDSGHSQNDRCIVFRETTNPIPRPRWMWKNWLVCRECLHIVHTYVVFHLLIVLFSVFWPVFLGKVRVLMADSWQNGCSVPFLRSLVKGKGFPYSLPSVGPRADPGVQAVSPQVQSSTQRTAFTFR